MNDYAAAERALDGLESHLLDAHGLSIRDVGSVARWEYETLHQSDHANNGAGAHRKMSKAAKK